MTVSESGGGVLPDHPPHLFFHANFLHSGSISIILVPLKREDAARANEIGRFFDKFIWEICQLDSDTTVPKVDIYEHFLTGITFVKVPK